MRESGVRAVYRLVVRNGLFGVGARVTTLAVGLVMTPYLLARLGGERFAVWALASIATGSLGLMDLGIRRALIKEVAQSLVIEKDDRRSLSQLLSSAVALNAAIAIALGILLTSLVAVAIRLLEIPLPLVPEARDVFLIVGIGVVVGAALAAFPALCDGMQRMDVTNGLGVLALVLGAAGMVYAVETGHGFRGVALAQLASIVLFYVSTILAVRILAPELRLSPWDVRTDRVAKLLGFGWRVHTASIATVAARHLDKILLSRWAGLGAVTSYELALKLSANATSLIDFLGAGMLPAASTLASSPERSNLIRDYERGMGFIAAAASPLFAFLFIEADTIMVAWLGPGAPSDAATYARILATGYVFAAVGSAMSHVAQGLGAPDVVLRYALLQLGLNVALSLVLLAWIGPLGAAAGTAIALAIGTLYLRSLLHPRLESPGARRVSLRLLRPVTLSIVAAIAARMAGHWLTGSSPLDRSSALLRLALEGVLFASAVAATLRRARLG